MYPQERTTLLAEQAGEFSRIASQVIERRLPIADTLILGDTETGDGLHLPQRLQQPDQTLLRFLSFLLSKAGIMVNQPLIGIFDFALEHIAMLPLHELTQPMLAPLHACLEPFQCSCDIPLILFQQSQTIMCLGAVQRETVALK